MNFVAANIGNTMTKITPSYTRMRKLVAYLHSYLAKSFKGIKYFSPGQNPDLENFSIFGISFLKNVML